MTDIDFVLCGPGCVLRRGHAGEHAANYLDWYVAEKARQVREQKDTDFLWMMLSSPTEHTREAVDASREKLGEAYKELAKK